MNEKRPILFRPGDAPADGLPVPDLGRRVFSDGGGRWAGWAERITNEPGDVSSWHFHPASETYVYVIRGAITIAFGPKGAESFTAAAGDFFVIPSQVVHRESTRADGEFEAFVIRVGELPEQIDVAGPPDGQ